MAEASSKDQISLRISQVPILQIGISEFARGTGSVSHTTTTKTNGNDLPNTFLYLSEDWQYLFQGDLGDNFRVACHTGNLLAAPGKLH